MAPTPLLIIVMGPASCGKSTIGSELARDLSIEFIDGDSLHPATNVAKMSKGIPLTDVDRLPWLADIRATAGRVCKEGAIDGLNPSTSKLGRPSVVIACSALKKWYRDILRGEVEAPDGTVASIPSADLKTIFVYCKGTPELLAQRIAARKGHFMGPEMLKSQLATLEDPSEEPGVVAVDISRTREEVAESALEGVKILVSEIDSV